MGTERQITTKVAYNKSFEELEWRVGRWQSVEKGGMIEKDRWVSDSTRKNRSYEIKGKDPDEGQSGLHTLISRVQWSRKVGHKESMDLIYQII